MLLIVSIVIYWQLFDEAAPASASEVPTSHNHSTQTDTPTPIQANPSLPQSPTRPTIQQTRSKSPSTHRSSTSTPSQAISYQGTAFQQPVGDFPYYTVEKKWNSQRKEYEFWRRGMYGSEIPLRIDARRYFLSENQSDYPEPASGCAPTALLNLYIWYSKFGLLKESIHHSNPETYKQLKFQEIDRKLLNIQRASRARNGGTNTLAAIVAMDELVQEFTRSPTRLHFDIKKPPLDKQDFINLSQGYRAGILSVRPKDPSTGRLMGNHAVLCIRGDTSGMITIANWGEFSHGSLVQRPDGQWFVPKDASEHELRINSLTTLIPFVPRNGT